MWKSLKLKIILPAVVILVFLVTVLMFYSFVRFSNYTSMLFDERIAITANGLKSYLLECERNTKVAAISMSSNTDIIKAVGERDTTEVARILSSTLDLYGVNYYTVTDETGIVLARTHMSENIGDSTLGQQNIKSALSGQVSTCYEEGTISKVSVRTGSPVYDRDGSLIGVISAGFRFDVNEEVDELKRRFNADFTVFLGDTRIATTITREGKRIVGTTIDPAIAEIVLGNKAVYLGHADIQGENHSTFYLPLINAQGDVFAILVAAASNAHLMAERRNLFFNETLISLLGLIISIIVLLLIISKILRPVHRLVHLIPEVTYGNMDAVIDRTHITNDEIGALLLDVFSLIDIVKSMVGDLSQLTRELNIYSDIDFQIDTDKYSGTYKEIIDRVKDLSDSTSKMQKTVTAMDVLDTMVNVIDMDYNLLFINHSMADAFLVDRKDCIGKKCYKAIRNLDEPCSICQLPNLLLSEDSYPTVEYEYVWDEVLGVWIGGKSSIIRWVDGGMAFFNSIKDETVKMNQREQFSEAAEAAKAASVAKSAFLANMSHELRTPLNVIVGLADLKLEESSLSEDIKEILEKMSIAGHTLLSIVNDILDISKIESGKFVFTPVEYFLASLLNDTVTMIATRIGEKPIALRLNINEDLPNKLFGDDLRVKQILNNLLGNAIKYTEKGSVELSVRCTREGGDVWMDITVSDTGIGIHKEKLGELFTDYGQVDTRANRRIEGTGLGLSITKRLVEIMDGEVSVESEYGVGSVFHARIRQGYITDKSIGPVIVENLRNFRYHENKSYLVDKLMRVDLSYASVLVVDDLQANLDVSTAMLRKYNMHVDCVTSGEAAIERIHSGSPVYNAIFMDHMMPGMDGIEATEAIRLLDTEYARSIPVIALTANAVAGTEDMFYEHGFQAFLPKPIDIIRLDSIVRQWIQDKSMGESVVDNIDKDPENDGAPEMQTPIIYGITADDGLLNSGGDRKLYSTVLRSYAADTAAVLEKIRNVTVETLHDYAVAVHGIKGSSANIGARGVRETAANLEKMAKAGNLSGILARNDAFLRDVQQLVSGIQAWAGEQDAKRVKQHLHAPDRALLVRLRECCEQFDIDSVDELMEVLEGASYEEDADLIAWLREKVDTLEFTEIAERLAGY